MTVYEIDHPDRQSAAPSVSGPVSWARDRGACPPLASRRIPPNPPAGQRTSPGASRRWPADEGFHRRRPRNHPPGPGWATRGRPRFPARPDTRGLTATAIRRPGRQARRRAVHRDITGGGDDVMFVHHRALKPAPPLATGLFEAGVDPSGLPPLRLGDGLTRGGIGPRRHNGKAQIGHQPVGPDECGRRRP